jgi:hypothetical protein
MKSHRFLANIINLCLVLFVLMSTKNVIAAEGCSLHGAGVISGGSNIRLVSFPGNSNFSDHFLGMILKVQNILDISRRDMPLVAIYDDSNGPNALAISNAWASTSVNAFYATYDNPNQKIRNAILFGENMLWELAYPVREADLNTVEIFAVLAHEFGHHMQYMAKQSPNNQAGKVLAGRLNSAKTPQIELMADTISGWVLGRMNMNSRKSLGKNSIRRTLQRMYNLGDFDFNSPNHHGTPKQRVAAFTYGYSLATEKHLDNKNRAFVAAFERYIGW